MYWFASSIRNKILAVFVLGLALVVAGALYGFAAARNGLATVEKVNDTLIAQAIEAQALEGTFKEQVQQWMSVLVRGHDPAALEKSWKQFTFREREVKRAAEKLREQVDLPGAKELLDKFLAGHAAMGTKYREGLEVFKSSGSDMKKVDALTKGIELDPADEIEELVKMMRDASEAAVAGARRSASMGLTFSLAVIGVATLLALAGCALLIMHTVARPLARAVAVVDRVAAGDLTVRVESDSRDETGRLLDGLLRMRDALVDTVSTIRESAETVGTASRQIATGHADLSARTEEQAASLEETASSMQQLAATVKSNADNARQANALADGHLEDGGPRRARDRRRGRDHGRHRRGLAAHRRHRGRDRLDRVPDQHPRAERRRGSGARGRAGTRLRRGGRGSARARRSGAPRPPRRSAASSRIRPPAWARASASWRPPARPSRNSWARCSA